jgi:pyrroloquinoline-quinone synthase
MKTDLLTMNISGSPAIGPYIKAEWLARLGNTDFLARCQNGQVSRAEMDLFVQQHHLYSRCFTRFLAASLAKIEDDDHRLALTHNLFDEMGLGDAGGLPHSKLYRLMMDNMGLAASPAPLPSTRQMVDTMFACCHSPNYMVGLGALCLGAEGIVPFVYQRIVDGFIGLGESPDNLQFFTLHIECDDGHAETMAEIIAWELQKTPNALLDLNYGAEKMIQARIEFFNGLSSHCANRSQYAA